MDETPVIVTAKGCTHCEELKAEHPEAFKVATEFELETPKCGAQPFTDGNEVCLTGADILQAANANYTPFCGLIDKEGNVRECNKDQYGAILEGKTPPPSPSPRRSRARGVESIDLVGE